MAESVVSQDHPDTGWAHHDVVDRLTFEVGSRESAVQSDGPPRQFAFEPLTESPLANGPRSTPTRNPPTVGTAMQQAGNSAIETRGRWKLRADVIGTNRHDGVSTRRFLDSSGFSESALHSVR